MNVEHSFFYSENMLHILLSEVVADRVWVSPLPIQLNWQANKFLYVFMEWSVFAWG